MIFNSTLKIAVLPVDIVDGDKKANFGAVERLMSRIDIDTDVVVLPELFSTGFVSDRDKMMELSEPNSGDTVAEIRRLAASYNVAVAGSFLARTASSMYNRGFFIEPSGEETFYDKHHLFKISAEGAMLSPGVTAPPVVRFRGWNIMMIVCYDLRFPVWCRNTDNRYDLMIVTANWPSARAYAWEHLLIARAIENQAYVIGANRSGRDGFGDYDNLSFVFDYLGRPTAVTGDKNKIVSAVLDKDKLNKFRDDFPVWNDGDKFSLQF